MGTATKPIHVHARRVIDKPTAFRVDYFANRQDFLCVLYAALGMETAAIGDMLNMTEGRVAYRIAKAERGKRRSDLTQRKSWRKGKSPMIRALVSQASQGSHLGFKTVRKQLDAKGLFTPRASGVLRHNGK